MEFSEFNTELLRSLEQNSIGGIYTEQGAKKLYELTKIMLEVNKSMNLTAITDEKAVITKHYVDSLTLSSYIPEGSEIIDVGCGAGFPTLPLAIFRKDITITALDSTAKRIKYLSETAAALGLTNVTTIAARAEELGKNSLYREKFDVATARAVASMPVLTELCLPFVKKGGLFLAMKAAQGSTELSDAKNAISTCGGVVEASDLLTLNSDSTSDSRLIAVVRKTSLTPSKYPRHYSQISKKPL